MSLFYELSAPLPSRTALLAVPRPNFRAFEGLLVPIYFLLLPETPGRAFFF